MKAAILSLLTLGLMSLGATSAFADDGNKADTLSKSLVTPPAATTQNVIQPVQWVYYGGPGVYSGYPRYYWGRPYREYYPDGYRFYPRRYGYYYPGPVYRYDYYPSYAGSNIDFYFGGPRRGVYFGF